MSGGSRSSPCWGCPKVSNNMPFGEEPVLNGGIVPCLVQLEVGMIEKYANKKDE